MIEVRCKGVTEVFTPEEISAMILEKMRETAEEFLGSPINNAVITVPAYFNDAQREVTHLAAVFAGLTVMKIINEPTAAALAYGFHGTLKEKRNIFIFDLGGGTFDVSILTIDENSHFEVLATAGDSHLGGQDFDNKLVNYLIEEFKRKNKKDISTNFKALYRLRLAVERAKRCLSYSTEAVIQIEAFCDGIDAYFKVTRAKFEAICSDLFQKTLFAIDDVLVEANLDKTDINDVVLVGGSTKMPKIKQMLPAYFVNKIQSNSVDPEEAVVRGAAIQAELLCGETDAKINDFFLLEIAPLSLGIETAGGVMSKIIKRGAKVPCRVTQIFTTFTDKQSAVTIQIFQGERSLTKNNYLLGTIVLSGIPSLPCGVPKIEVSFYLDVKSILHVEGKETSTGVAQSIKIESKYGGLMHREIKRLVLEAKKFMDEDETSRVKIEAHNKLQKFIYQVKQAAIEYEGDLKLYDKMKLQWECENCLMWLKEHRDATPMEFEEKYNYLLSICEQCNKRAAAKSV